MHFLGREAEMREQLAYLLKIYSSVLISPTSTPTSRASLGHKLVCSKNLVARMNLCSFLWTSGLTHTRHVADLFHLQRFLCVASVNIVQVKEGTHVLTAFAGRSDCSLMLHPNSTAGGFESVAARTLKVDEHL